MTYCQQLLGPQENVNVPEASEASCPTLRRPVAVVTNSAGSASGTGLVTGLPQGGDSTRHSGTSREHSRKAQSTWLCNIVKENL